MIAKEAHASVVVRPDEVSTFMEHEGKFRRAAWESIDGKEGDWVLCLDADEFLTDDPRPHARGMVKGFHVQEVFGVIDGDPMIRTDGYWNQITATRMAPWTPLSEFPDKAMGSGSLPDIYSKEPSVTLEAPQILHYGYAVFEDRLTKYERYRGRTGHNPKHVDSILKEPTLRPGLVVNDAVSVT